MWSKKVSPDNAGKILILTLLFFLLQLGKTVTAQNINQGTVPNWENSTPIDINSKAEELGITPEHLKNILNTIPNNASNRGDDPIPEAMQERFFTGAAGGDFFGYSVFTAGDVNGDGFDDVIVGAYNNDAGGDNAGRAYIYFGGNIINSIADVILTGAASDDLFGRSVCTAGDVNGDGFDDVIVGANNNDAGGTNAGRAYIYFGGSIMDSTADVILTGAAANDYFGYSVSTAGDVNGDGYSDVIVGAFLNDGGGTNFGRAYIYFGGSGMDNTADVLLTGAGSGEYFAYSVSTAGDVNGDGYSDVIVSAYLNDGGGTNAGSAYIYFGGSAMDNIADVILTGAAEGDNFGYSVSTAGDVNEDGYTDVIIGALFNDDGGTDAGSAYIYFGGSSMDNTADVLLTGTAAADRFGTSVSTAGDVNGDGFTDVIVGASLNDAGGTNTGRAYIYFGGSAMDNIADVILTGAAADDRFGYSVSAAGDVNADGYSDVIVGAYFNDAGGTSAGRAYLYTNSLTGTDLPDEFFTGAAAGDAFGYSLSTAGDVNGDGFTDVIVGAFNNDAGGTNAGRAYIYFGGSGLDSAANVILTGAAASDYFGRSVSTAGDVNGDGYGDVIVGANGNDAGGSNAGRAYIYFGGSIMDSTKDVILTGVAANDEFGRSVSTAGDVNGDGYSDVIVGAIYNDAGGTNAGRAYIYFGGTSMDSTKDVILTGTAAYDYFGYSVSTAGNINGDGYSDVIVGAYNNDAGGTDAGRAYIYYGGSSMDSTVDVILTGTAASDYFAYSVSDAGDVNEDGYSDVIVGAYGNDAGGNNAGRAYIYFGGIGMNNTADVLLTGAAANDWFGYSVSTAGDINGDGYSDVIVGAMYNNAGGDNAGRAYIYFGGTAMDNTVDVILTGEATSDAFGSSVSSAGDVNGDRYSDVIVGAHINDAGGSNAGRAYLYLSSSPPIKPRIMTVKDVPNDQGGYVFVNFVRSGYDARGQSNIITEYLIEMSNPPGVNGFSWWQAGSVQPVQNPLYTFIAPTPNDSMTNNSGTLYFRITARTSDPNQYWRSNILYGHSVDNLAPLPPMNFDLVLAGGNVNLLWSPNLEVDLKDYVLYRTDYAGADPDTLTSYAIVPDTLYIDTDPLPGTSYYYLRARDIHGNESEPVSDEISVLLSANIRLFLEGSYVGGQMSTFLNVSDLIPLNQPFNTTTWNYTGTESVAGIPENITDWILVELRSDETTVAETRAAFIKNDGTLVDLDGVNYINFPDTPEGEYYVVMIHRNHLPVMTADKITLSNSPPLYDIRTDPAKAYGSGALKDLGGGYYGIYTGDTDGSGTVNAADRSNTWNQRNLSGYYGTDVDLSGTVNAADRSTVWNNRNLSTRVPTPTDNPVIKVSKGGQENE